MSSSAAFETQFATPEESPGYQLWRVTCAWQRQIRAALHPLGLTHVQFVLLTVMAYRETTLDGAAGMTQQEIADSAAIDKMMTSQVLRALEGKKLIVRRRIAGDSRAWRVDLTEAGRTLAAQGLERVEAADIAYFSALGSDGTRQLARLLAKLSAGSAGLTQPAA